MRIIELSSIWSGLYAAIFWLCGVLYLPTLLADYDAVSMTISELGAWGTPLANLVNFGWSIPLGLLQGWAVYGEWRRGGLPAKVGRGLAAFGCIGIAYIACGLFPCDVGSPLWGSWRQLLHNAFGGLEYLGGGLGLLWFSVAMRHRPGLAATLRWSGIAVIVGLLVMSVPGLFAVRGAAQRAVEALLFSWLAWASVLRLAGGELWPKSLADSRMA